MSELKPGDLVHVKNYFRNAVPVAGGIHGIVVDVEKRLTGSIYMRQNPIVEILTADGLFNYYTAGNLKLLVKLLERS